MAKQKLNKYDKLTVSELAAFYGCSRQTIYANKDKFTWVSVPGAKAKKILLDHKADGWCPNRNKINNRFIKQSTSRFHREGTKITKMEISLDK